MQSVHETYVVPALKSNNIAVFTVMWLPIPSLHAVKTWSQKKESDPSMMREPTAVPKRDFVWHEQRHCRKEECLACGKTRTGSKSWKGRKTGSKEEGKKERNKLHSYP